MMSCYLLVSCWPEARHWGCRLQLLGFSDLTASSLMALFAFGCALGAFAGGWIGKQLRPSPARVQNLRAELHPVHALLLLQDQIGWKILYLCRLGTLCRPCLGETWPVHLCSLYMSSIPNRCPA